MAYVYGRIRRLTVEEFNNVYIYLKLQVVNEVFLLCLPRNHQCVIYQRECCHNLSAILESTISRQCRLTHSLLPVLAW